MRRRWSILVALHATGSLLTISRSAVLALATGMIVLLWAWTTSVRVKAIGFALVLLVILRAAAPGLLGTLRSLFTWWSADPSVEGRTKDYAIVARFISQRPYFGRGVDTFIPAEYFFLDNAYLMRILNTGYAGLLTLLLLLLFGLGMSRLGVHRQISHSLKHLSVAHLAAMAVVAVSAGTFDFFSFPTVSGLLALFLGTSAVLAQPRPVDRSSQRYAPTGLLRSGYRHGYRHSPWWHRFDPELATLRSKYIDLHGKPGDLVERRPVDSKAGISRPSDG